MAILKDNAIVLTSKSYLNTDIWTQILTQTHGKQNFIVKGLQKSRRRSGWIINGNIVHLTYYYRQSRDHQYIQELEILFSPMLYPLSYLKIQNLSSVLNVLINKVPLSEPNPQIYDLTSGFLQALIHEDDNKLINLALFTQFRLMRYLGLLDWPICCYACGLELDDNLYWFRLWPGLSCPSCSKKQAGQAQALEKNEMVFLQQALRHNWSQVKTIQLSQRNHIALMALQATIFRFYR